MGLGSVCVFLLWSSPAIIFPRCSDILMPLHKEKNQQKRNAMFSSIWFHSCPDRREDLEQKRTRDGQGEEGGGTKVREGSGSLGGGVSGLFASQRKGRRGRLKAQGWHNEGRDIIVKCQSRSLVWVVGCSKTHCQQEWTIPHWIEAELFSWLSFRRNKQIKIYYL